jgi:hypothetical protein
MPVMPTAIDPGLVPPAMLSRTTATAPDPIEVVPSAKTSTRAPPEIALPLADFPAAVAAAPVVVETYANDDGNVRSNWSVLTPVAPAVKDTVTSTAVPALPLAVPTLTTGAWANAVFVDETNIPMITIEAINRNAKRLSICMTNPSPS